jgi:hypothetical protein
LIIINNLVQVGDFDLVLIFANEIHHVAVYDSVRRGNKVAIYVSGLGEQIEVGMPVIEILMALTDPRNIPNISAASYQQVKMAMLGLRKSLMLQRICSFSKHFQAGFCKLPAS